MHGNVITVRMTALLSRKAIATHTAAEADLLCSAVVICCTPHLFCVAVAQPPALLEQAGPLLLLCCLGWTLLLGLHRAQQPVAAAAFG
jgi:hypothetical protein